MPRYAVFACLLAAVVVTGVFPSSVNFWRIFGGPGSDLDWRTADEMKGLVDEDMYQLMLCYSAMNTNRSVSVSPLGPFRVHVETITYPVFTVKNNIVYTANKTEIVNASGLKLWLLRLRILSNPSGISYSVPFEGRCVVKVNETHYKLIVAFYEKDYLGKTAVVSAVTPKDYKYPRDYKRDFFRKEEHGCRILSVKYTYGAYRENPPVPCDYMNYYWDRPNPLTAGFMAEFKKLIEREKLPRNAAIPIVVSFTGTLMKYPDDKPNPIIYFDPATRTFGELPSPLKKGEVHDNEDADWHNMMVGRGWCASFVAIAVYILRYLGIDAYSVAVDVYGAHSMLGINESDIKGLKIEQGDDPFVVTVQRDDGMVARIHLLEMTAKKKPLYPDYHGRESKWFSFIQYNSI